MAPRKLLAKAVAAIAIAVFWSVGAVGTTVGTTVGVTTFAAAVTAATRRLPRQLQASAISPVAVVPWATALVVEAIRPSIV